MPDDLSKSLLDIDQVAALLRCDADTAADRLNRGELPGMKFGRGWIVPAEALYRRLNEMAIEEAERRRTDQHHALDDGVRNVRDAEPMPCMAAAQSTTGQRGRKRRAAPDLSRYSGLLAAA